MSAFDVYPAIDVRGGRVVRLRRANTRRRRAIRSTPLAVAERYAAAGPPPGCTWSISTRRAMRAIRSWRCCNASAGFDRPARADRRRRARRGGRGAPPGRGAERVVIGSLAVRRPQTVVDWFAHYGHDRITVALDTRALQRRLDIAGRGLDARRWRRPVRTCRSLCHRRAAATCSARTSSVTACSLDRMSICNRAIIRRAPRVRVQASGGARSWRTSSPRARRLRGSCSERPCWKAASSFAGALRRRSPRRAEPPHHPVPRVRDGASS